MNAVMTKRMLDALRKAAGTHWRQPSGRNRRYRVGPDIAHDYVTYRGDSLFRAESQHAAVILALTHLHVQEGRIRNKALSYRSLRTGDRLIFRIRDLELLRPLDPALERSAIGKLNSPEFKVLPEGLITASHHPKERGQAILTHEACDAVRLLNMLLEYQNHR